MATTFSKYGMEHAVFTPLALACEAKENGALLDISLESLFLILSSQGRDFTSRLVDQLHDALLKELGPHDRIVPNTQDRLYLLLRHIPDHALPERIKSIGTFIQEFGCSSSPEPVCLVARIGAASFYHGRFDPQSILDQSYIALNDARDMGRHYVLFHQRNEFAAQARNQLVLANYLQNALLHNRLRLAFQPIIESKTGEVSYHESLLRIVDDSGNVVSAGPFIPVAEKMGFIDVLDGLVLEMVARELRHAPNLTLSLNVSNETIAHSDWLAMATRTLSDPSIASRLVVEITETTEIRDFRKVERFIKTLKDLGCRVALDDFGAGYTSFAHLKKLKIDLVKIDGAFVRDVLDNEQSRLFIKTLLDFTNSLKLKTVAEFVESLQIAEIMKAMKVDYLQGNYFSPAVNYRSWL